MSQHAAELCSLLINEIYGELSSHVFNTLLQFGRLSLPLLRRRSNLSIRQIKHGLAILIQQHLVLHYTGPEDVSTYYEADWEAAYALIRCGGMITIAENKFGPAAGHIVSSLLLLGHTTIRDLLKICAGPPAQGETEQTEGNSATVEDVSHEKRAASEESLETESQRAPRMGFSYVQAQAVIRELHGRGLVTQVQASHFHSFTDKYNEAVRGAKREGRVDGAKGSKNNRAFESVVRERLRDLRDGASDGEGEIDGSSKKVPGLKRRLEDASPSPRQKRFRANSRTGHLRERDGNGLRDMEPTNDESLPVRVSPEKHIVWSRNQRLVEECERKISSITARVYAALLDKLSDDIPRCHDRLAKVSNEDEEEPETGPSVTAHQLASVLHPDIDLSTALGKEGGSPKVSREQERRTDRRRKRRQEDSDGGEEDSDDDKSNSVRRGECVVNGHTSEAKGDINGDDSSDADPQTSDEASVDNERLRQVEQQLRLLAQEPHYFTRLVRKSRRNEWTVDYDRLITRLQQAEFAEIISKRFGTVALRLIRILSEKGKLDEKQISNMALVKQKEIRAALTAMHQAGFLELQEVPRDNYHNVNRTIYLWFFDPQRCSLLVLDNTYKIMARLLQRIAAEREDLRSLLDKAERTDVVGKEDQYLTERELTELQRWREKEAKLLAQLMRLDRQVELLRDF